MTLQDRMNGNVKELTAENWQAEVLEGPDLVLVDFWAEWCGPCVMLGPVIEAVAEEFSGRVKVGKLNVDDQGAIADRYSVRAIPNLLLFRGGQVVEQRTGFAPREELARFLREHLATQPA